MSTPLKNLFARRRLYPPALPRLGLVVGIRQAKRFPESIWLRRLGRALLFAAAVVLTVIIAYPANWLAYGIANASAGRVLLTDGQGTLWNGSAVLALRSQTNSSDVVILPGRLQWEVLSQALWSGDLRLALHHAQAIPNKISVDVGLSGMQSQSGQLQLPASLLEGLGAPFNTLKPQGRLTLEWSDLRFAWWPRSAAGIQPGGQLEFRIEQLSSSLSPVKPLGNYRMSLVFQTQNHTTLHLQTDKGPLLIHGQGSLENGRLRFDGQATAEPQDEEALRGLLSLLGRKQGNVVQLSFP